MPGSSPHRTPWYPSPARGAHSKPKINPARIRQRFITILSSRCSERQCDIRCWNCQNMRSATKLVADHSGNRSMRNTELMHSRELLLSSVRHVGVPGVLVLGWSAATSRTTGHGHCAPPFAPRSTHRCAAPAHPAAMRPSRSPGRERRECRTWSQFLLRLARSSRILSCPIL